MYNRKRVIRKVRAKPKAMPKTQLATKSYVKRLIKGSEELKHHAIQQQNVSLNVGSIEFIRPVEGILQDSLTGDRIGSELHFKYMDIYHRFFNVNDAESGYVRLFVVIDKAYESTNGLEMFQSVNMSSNDPVTYVNTGRVDQIHWALNKHRWTVLYDTRLKLSDPVNDSNNPCEKFIKKRLFINKKIKYVDTTNKDTNTLPNIKVIWFTEKLNDGSTWTTALNTSFCYTMWYTDA